MDFVPNTTIFRRTPSQSGVYEADIGITQKNHSSSMKFLFSGAGSTFFEFGSNSGNYYASGDEKLYLKLGTPYIKQNYSIVLDSDSYDVYGESNNVIALGISKPSGILERVYIQTESGIDGGFDFTLKGDIPSYNITGNLLFPNQQQYQTSIALINSGSVPFSILSGNFISVNYISILSSFPINIDAGQEASLIFSGRFNSDESQGSTLNLYTDFGTIVTDILFSPTSISGSGHAFSSPEAPVIDYQGTANLEWSITNTGTQTFGFSPILDRVSRAIPIGTPSLNNVPLRNMFSGYLDTTSQLFFSDKISFPSGEFFIVQESQAGFALISRTGTPITGWSLGASENLYVGQTFELPYYYQLTGVTAWMYKGTGTSSGDEEVYLEIREGAGVTGDILATSIHASISNISTGIGSSAPFSFSFASPFEIRSGVQYSMVMGGSSSLLSNPVGSVNVTWLMQTGVAPSSGFYVDSSNITYTTGNMYLSIDWLKPSDCHRYLLNMVSGVRDDFTLASTGSYDKYMAEKSFIIEPSSMISHGGETTSFNYFYTGVVSGLNTARLRFSGTSYDQTISGFTV